MLVTLHSKSSHTITCHTFGYNYFCRFSSYRDIYASQIYIILLYHLIIVRPQKSISFELYSYHSHRATGIYSAWSTFRIPVSPVLHNRYPLQCTTFEIYASLASHDWHLFRITRIAWLTSIPHHPHYTTDTCSKCTAFRVSASSTWHDQPWLRLSVRITRLMPWEVYGTHNVPQCTLYALQRVIFILYSTPLSRFDRH